MKRNKNTFKITIGIPAHNEQGNIYKLLKSLISQQLPENFQIESINVFSDGSNDKTVKRARVFKDKKIKVFDFTERMGKNFRLNQMFKNLKGDALVLFDADTIISDTGVVANLVKPFSEIDNSGFVAGNAQPLPSQTLIEEAVNNFVYSLNFMKNRINRGNNIYSVRGPIVALSKDFAKKITLPINVPDDRYLYLKCLQLGFNFSYSKKALVFYRSPQTIKDQINQGFRFLKDKENLYMHFESQELDKQYFIPFKLKIGMLLFQVFRNPLAYLTMKFIHLQVLRNRKETQNHKWQMVLSSKKLV
jgi:glycosyltransferase involved in cell wall biosynthesis